MDKNIKFDNDCIKSSPLEKKIFEKREIEEKLRCAIKIANLGIWDWNLENNSVQLSKEVFEITGHNSSDFDGSMDYILNKIIHSQSQDSIKVAIEKALETGFVTNGEYRINHPNKKNCWINLNGETIYNDSGDKVKIIGTLNDITDDYLTKYNLFTNLSFFESLVENLPNPIFYKDYHGLYRFCNSAFLKYLGLKKDEIINKSVYDIAPKDLATVYHKADLDLMLDQGKQVYEANVKYADGTLHDVIFSKAAHIGENGKTIGLVGLMQDITDKKNIERRINSLAKAKDVFWKINQSIMAFENKVDFFNRILTDLQSVFTHASHGTVLEIDDSEVITILTSNGYNKEEVKNFKLDLSSSYLSDNKEYKFNRPLIINNVQSFIEAGFSKVVFTDSQKNIQSSLVIPMHIDGALKWIISFDSNDNNVFSDIDSFVADYIGEELPLFYRIFKLYRETLHLSRYDSLTSLMNRGFFDVVFSDRLNVSDRLNENTTLVMFDLDGLKEINDKYGHFYGDLYIKRFSELLVNNFRKSDSFARIGGDEFSGIFTDTNIEVLIESIENLRKLFMDINFQTNDTFFKGSFSYGIANFPEDAKTKSNLMILADKRMYEYKRLYKK